ncbi:MAG: Conserved putative secreted protein [Thermoleophilia bacterium]|nr:Conserved putative secreted protein [Thermoleophilia bacterium]
MHPTVGPPAPDSLWPGAPAARDAHEQASFQQALQDAPPEVDGECTRAVDIEGVGRGCRTEDGLLRIALADGSDMLTHGPDYVDAATDIEPDTTAPHIASAVQNASKSDISCVTSAEAPTTPHTKLVYAVPADGIDRSATKVPAFRQSTYEASAVIDNTARKLGGTTGRRINVLCDGAGNADVTVLRLPRVSSTYAFDSNAGFGLIRSDIPAQLGIGSATKVRFLVYYDAHLGGFSGIGSLYSDTTAGATNNNNLARAMALQDNSGGSGPSWYVLLHEISHNMGAVQNGMPDANGYTHCNDGRDVMCYAEGAQPYVTTACLELQYDCDADSYFNPVPTGVSPLATNWNSAATYNRYLQSYAAAVDTTPPASPTGLVGSGHGDFYSLSWTGVADPDLHTYRIERDIGGGVWRTVDDSWDGATSVDVTWTGITSSSSHSLRVRAYDMRGNLSAPSNVLSLLPRGSTDGSEPVIGGPAPAPPTNLVVGSTTASSILLQWSKEGSSGSGFELWRYDDAWDEWYRSYWSTGGDAINVTGLTSSARYQFRVRLVDEGGRTSPFADVSGWTTNPADVSAPDMPSGLSITSTVGNVPTVSWNPVPGAADYVVTAELTAGVHTEQAIVSGTTFAVTGFPFGVSGRAIRVSARDESGNRSSFAGTTFSTGTAPDTQSPGAPVLVTRSTIFNTSVAGIDWNGPADSDIAGYRVLAARQSTPFEYQVAATTNASTTIADAVGLVPGTAYNITVETFDTSGYVTRANSTFPVITNADGAAPTTPTGLVASSQTPTSIRLDWAASTDDSGVASYRVYQTSPNAGVVATVTHPTANVTISGLAASTSYTFDVQAVDVADVVSAHSSSVTTSTTASGPDNTPPTTPGTPTASNLAGHGVTLTWTASTDAVGVAGYRVEQTAPVIAQPVLTTTTGLTYDVAPLIDATTYTFRVVAFDAAGNQTPSSTRTIATPDVTAPDQLAPIAVGTRTSSTIQLSWSTPFDNVGVTGYRVRNGASLLYSPTGTNQIVANLAPLTPYTFAIEARDLAGNWSTARTVSTSTPDTVAPASPANLRMTSRTGTSISLEWDPASDDVATAGYRLYQVVAGSDVLVVNKPGLTHTVVGLSNATAYWFRIEAYDTASNTSGKSSLATSTLDAIAPTTATNLAPSSITGTSMRVTWDPATDLVGVTGYDLERLVGGSWTPVGSRSLVQFRDVTGLTSGVSYSYRVRAFDAAGNASTSPELAVATLDTVAPGVPTSLVASSRTGSSFHLAWSAPSDNVGVVGYVVYVNNVAVGTPTSTQFDVSGLNQSTTYSVQVSAIDGTTPAPNESSRATISVSTIDPGDITPPTTPSLPSATNVTNSSMRLTWSPSTDNSGGIDGYQVHRLMGDGVSWQYLYYGLDTFFDLSGLAPGTTYTFRIRAYDSSGNFATTGNVVIATGAAADATAPTQPVGPAAATATEDGTVKLSWGASTDAVGVTGYRVSRLTGAGYILQDTTPGIATTLLGQPIGTNTTYAIAAVDAAGNISSALVVTVTIPAPPPPPPIATPASGFAASVTATRVVLSWQQANSDTIGWRVVERRNGTTISTRDVISPTATFGPYAPLTNVSYELYTRYAASTSTAVTLDIRTAADTVKPTKPGKFKATSPAKGTLALSWTKSTDDVAFKAYEVKLTTKGAKPKVVKLPANATKTKVVKLKAKAAYSVQIRALDAAGNASAWVTVSARTK